MRLAAALVLVTAAAALAPPLRSARVSRRASLRGRSTHVLHFADDDDDDDREMYRVSLPEPAERVSEKVWSACKRFLPALVTGAWSPEAGDEGASMMLYNMLLIRLPVICAGAWYSKEIAYGGGLLEFDLGLGPFALPPGVVLVILAIILLPIL